MDSSSVNGVIMHHMFNHDINEESKMNSSVVGLDIAKNVFHLFSVDGEGQIFKKKLKPVAGR